MFLYLESLFENSTFEWLTKLTCYVVFDVVNRQTFINFVLFYLAVVFLFYFLALLLQRYVDNLYTSKGKKCSQTDCCKFCSLSFQRHLQLFWNIFRVHRKHQNNIGINIVKLSSDSIMKQIVRVFRCIHEYSNNLFHNRIR